MVVPGALRMQRGMEAVPGQTHVVGAGIGSAVRTEVVAGGSGQGIGPEPSLMKPRRGRPGYSLTMAWFYTVLGVVLAAVGLVDVFQTLLHPGGRGKLSRLVTRGVWAVSRMTGGPVRSIVGPLAIAAVVIMWVALEVLGWALICLPHVPDGFIYSSGLDPAAYPDFAEAVYISLVTISTLGFGDVVPT